MVKAVSQRLWKKRVLQNQLVRVGDKAFAAFVVAFVVQVQFSGFGGLHAARSDARQKGSRYPESLRL